MRTPAGLVAALIAAATGSAALGQVSTPGKPAPAKTSQPKTDDPAKRDAPGRGNPIDLRPKFKQGQQSRYVMTLDSVNKTKSPELPELDQDQTMHREFGLLMRVVDAAPDSSTVELVYESVKMKIVSDTLTAEYDSTKPAGTRGRGSAPGKATPPRPKQPTRPPQGKQPGAPVTTPAPGQPPVFPGGLADMDDNEMLASAVKGIVGTVVTMKFDGNGNITSVSGTGSLVPNSSIPGLGGGLGGLGGGGGNGGAGGGGPWSISSPGQSGFARVGETWRNSDSLGLTPIGNFVMNTSHTLQSAGGGRANVKVDGRIEQASASSGAGGAGGGEGYQIRSGIYRGNYVWDTDNGQLAEMNTDQSIDMDGKPMGMQMSMSAKQTVKVKRVK